MHNEHRVLIKRSRDTCTCCTGSITVSLVEMRIGELARRTRVGVSTLRAWERRFGFLDPPRSSSGQRLYTEADVERVSAVCRLVEEGLTLSAAIGRVANSVLGVVSSGDDEAIWLHRILQAADIGIWVSQDGQLRYANRRMAEHVGCSVDDLLERSSSWFFDPDEIDAITESEARGRTGRRQTFDVRLRRADSSPFLAEVRTTPLRTSQGSYEATVAVVIDVTARRHAEAEERFRIAMLDAIGEAVIATDPDGTIVFANPAAERLFGWRASELIGQNGLHILPAHAVDSSNEIHTRLLDGDRYSGEVEMTRRDGSHFTAHVSGSPVFDGDNEIVGLIAVLSDSSERHRQERDLRTLEQQAETVDFLGLRALRSDPNDLDLVVAEAVDATRWVLESDISGLCELGPGRDVLTARVTSPSTEQPTIMPAGGRYFAGYTVLAGKVVTVEDSRSDRRFEMHSAGQFGIVSGIAAPVFGPSGICGVLSAGCKVPRKFDLAATHFIQSMANVVGVALHRMH